jgi:hypothetical protein
LDLGEKTARELQKIMRRIFILCTFRQISLGSSEEVGMEGKYSTLVQMINKYNIFAGTAEGKRLFGTQWRRRQDNIKVDPKRIQLASLKNVSCSPPPLLLFVTISVSDKYHYKVRLYLEE